MSKELNSIGLAVKDTADLANSLNDLLANYQIFYMNTRGFHWNIKGDKFFELHLKFEELYTDAQLKIDEIAERILTLGHTPMHAYADYLTTSEIKPHKDVIDGYQAVRFILESFKILITKERALLKLSSDAEDEGTNAQMSDYIRAQEKLVWMYSSFLGKENQ